jgi:hypothetical protein
MYIPGFIVHHRIITDQCRANRGDYAAASEALATAQLAVDQALGGYPPGSGWRIHVAVTVERADGLNQPTPEEGES